MTTTSKAEELQAKINTSLGITEQAGYKFLVKGMKSSSGNQKWKLGKWTKFDGELQICRAGFHSCDTPLKSLDFVLGDIWAIVESRGSHLTDKEKQVWEEMRIVKKLGVKRILVRFALLCVSRSLHYFEEEYPDDKRPRQALEAVEAYVKNPSPRNRSAARSAARSAESAARSAESAARSAAWSAARSAAWSAAWSAARSAESAAWSAAWSAARSAARSAAWSAARSAESAARSAARSAERRWQEETLLGLILEEVSR